MKNRSLVFAREEARIYKNHYRPSLNIFRFVKTILLVIFSGSTNVTHTKEYGR